MPFASDKQRRYLFKFHPEIAKKYAKHGKKKGKRKKKLRKKAFLEGFWAELEKQSFFDDVKPPDAFAGNARAAADLKASLLKDPFLAKEEKVKLMAMLEHRPPTGTPPAHMMGMGAAIPDVHRRVLAAYADSRHSEMAPFLRKVLRLGLLAAKPGSAYLSVKDRRKKPWEEREKAQWAKGFFE